jgi:predicted nucleotide-binding protein (sugar kinase/HSP70/actin superfamily)
VLKAIKGRSIPSRFLTFNDTRISCGTNFSAEHQGAVFSKKMKEDGYTILTLQMSPTHFTLIEAAFRVHGFKVKILKDLSQRAIDLGQQYVNNDSCYPSIMIVGQFLEALTSGEYDTEHTALLTIQTQGNCRASGFPGLLRKALLEAEYGMVPVIGLSFSDAVEEHPGFKITKRMVLQGVFAVCLGDLLMQCLHRMRPYELVKGSAEVVYDKYLSICATKSGKLSYLQFLSLAKTIIRRFDEIELVDGKKKARVGVIGEIMVMYNPYANRGLVKTIEAEGCEAVVPGMINYFLYAVSNIIWRHKDLTESKKREQLALLAIKLFNILYAPINRQLKLSRHFEPLDSILSVADVAKDVLSLCNNSGEGWLLPAEAIQLTAKSNTPNIVFAQPFCCIANHMSGPGTIKEIRRRYPESNIVPVYFDSGISEINQLNRIKLMIAVAKDNFAQSA